MKIYLHGAFDSPTNRALFYNTPLWNDYVKIIVLDASHEIGDELRTKLSQFQQQFFETNNFVYDREFDRTTEPGIHIIPSNIHGLQDRIVGTGDECRYYIFDTANLEPYNIFGSLDRIKNKSNCKFFTSVIHPESNKIFDFGFILRKFIANRIVFQHFHCNDIFKKMKKKYRMDLSVRNFPQKDERIELLKSLSYHEEENIYLRINDYYVDR